MTMTTKPNETPKIDFFIGHSNNRLKSAHTEKEFAEYLSFWLGRSCGARWWDQPTQEIKHLNGIAMYPGKLFEGQDAIEWSIAHIETKNGPITIVNDLTQD